MTEAKLILADLIILKIPINTEFTQRGVYHNALYNKHNDYSADILSEMNSIITGDNSIIIDFLRKEKYINCISQFHGTYILSDKGEDAQKAGGYFKYIEKEKNKTVNTMISEITEYLYTFKDEDWHELNEFLQSNYTGKEPAIREALVKLVLAKRIEVKSNAHTKLNQHKRINDSDVQNTLTTLDNWVMEAKLTMEEKEKMDKEKNKQNPIFIDKSIKVGGNFEGIANTGDNATNSSIPIDKKEKTKFLTTVRDFLVKEFAKWGLKEYVFSGILILILGYLGLAPSKDKKLDKPTTNQATEQKASPADTTGKKDSVVP